MESLLSERISTLPASATIAMNQRATALRAQGHDVIDLSIGEPDFQTPAFVQAAAKEAIDAGQYFSYPPVAGYADLRAAIAEKLRRENGIDCTPDQVVVSNGAKQSIANVLLCLLNPGDEVIVYTPYWVSYASIIRLAGGRPVFLQGSAEDHFVPTPAQLASAITPRTKAVMYSSPCNPTGHVLTRTVLEAMAAVLVQHPHVLAIADEIYEYINFVGEHTSLAALQGMQGRVVTVNGFSKGFAMTGWRIGYLAAPPWLARACEKIQGQTTSAPSSIAQRAALAALRGCRADAEAMAASYRQRRDLVCALLHDIPGVRVPQPSGAFYVFPDVSDYFGSMAGNAEALCLYLLEEAHVALVTGSAFGVPQHVRLSYAVDEGRLRTAIHRIKIALAKLRANQ